MSVLVRSYPTCQNLWNNIKDAHGETPVCRRAGTRTCFFKKMLDNFFGGWYKTKKLEISNFDEVIFHKSKQERG